ncbi:hypothetical protein EDD86DRAFT_211790 [Gorgonomyces haynaldii]|nr:hypothetical protein EDD86DRAFT_211790 [Gorgonomyces haynaldii]
MISMGSTTYVHCLMLAPQELTLKPLKQQLGKHLVASIKLSGYMPDHLDTVTYFALGSANKMEMPTVVVSPLAETKRWYVNKGPFVHAKTKELFERVTHARVLQIYDTHLDNVKQLRDYISNNLPPGIDIELTTWEHVRPGFAKNIQIPDVYSYKNLMEDVVKSYLDHFNGKGPKPDMVYVNGLYQKMKDSTAIEQ